MGKHPAAVAWDMIGDLEVDIFVVAHKRDGGKRVFARDVMVRGGDKYRVVRPFMLRSEAERHMSNFADSEDKVVVVTAKLADLVNTLERGKKKANIEDVEVIVSTYGADKKIYDIETVWTFFKN